jgi:DnaJ-class molecular chaperone
MSTMDWYYKKLLPKRVKMGCKHTMATENTVGTQPTDNQQTNGGEYAQICPMCINGVCRDHTGFFGGSIKCPTCGGTGKQQ